MNSDNEILVKKYFVSGTLITPDINVLRQYSIFNLLVDLNSTIDYIDSQPKYVKIGLDLPNDTDSLIRLYEKTLNTPGQERVNQRSFLHTAQLFMMINNAHRELLLKLKENCEPPQPKHQQSCSDQSKSETLESYSEQKLSDYGQTRQSIHCLLQEPPVLKTRSFPKYVRGVLMDWISSNMDCPYPTSKEKDELLKKTGLNINQLNNWFSNTRRRYVKNGVPTKNFKWFQ